ncbi:helix-turn-helix domain-containing protein [Pararhizobium gei]|uniref:helix-turn-helix domain-containing protein n=1 Tax=Pararhizobium gei TaxID=1395951 RepID=UPI0023D9EFE7|nr:helix-turn-helix transcriptional regulator [Rhizobium gei]
MGKAQKRLVEEEAETGSEFVVDWDVQKLTIGGQNYVLLSEEDYEDLIDGLIATKTMVRIADGEETWPMEIVAARARGENSVKVYRTYRGLSMSQLAEAAGISQPYLSEIEAGKKTGSVDVLKRIAIALKVDLDDLVVEVTKD